METPDPRQPGDRILNRVAPGLGGEERAAARERLEQLAELLVRIAVRQVKEERTSS
jgi:hypothetical protein